jgi:hypothetical protein
MIDVPDAVSTVAEGINDDGVTHGFLLTDDFSTIDFPGATSTVARGINTQNQIVGSYIDEHGTEHGFLASPCQAPQ